MKRFATTSMVVAIFALAACGSGGGGGGGGSDGGSGGISMSVSGGVSTLAVGTKIGVIDVPNSSLSCAGSYGTPVHSGTSAAVSVAGTTVHMTVTLNRGNMQTSYLESYYLDRNANGVLDNGDVVWGASATGFQGACFTSANSRVSPDTFNWDTLATGFGGSTTWAGGTQTFSADGEYLGPGIEMSGTVFDAESGFSELGE